MEAPWTNLDPSFTFSEAELCDVLTFVSGLADDADADGGACQLPRGARAARSSSCAPTERRAGRLAARGSRPALCTRHARVARASDIA